MQHYYCDSSALVKLYVRERGTDWMRAALLDHGCVLYTARVSAVEIVAALSQRRRGGSAPEEAVAAALSELRSDLAERVHLVEITEELAELAMALAERLPLRGYDAIQLAAALELERVRRALSLSAVTFVCADGRPCAAAQSEGLPVVDPATVAAAA